MPQSGQFQTPAKPERVPGFPENFQYIVFDGFKGLNTKPTRPAIEDQQMYYCDNWMPLGENNLRTMWDHGAILFTVVGITTWNPNDKLNIVLSNGNLTAAGETLNQIGVVRATTAKKTSKHYYEAVHQVASLGSGGIGIASPSAILTNYVGADNQGWGYFPNGQVYNNGTVVATLQSYALNSVIGIAVDCDNKSLWFRVDTGPWNNSITADPVTNVSGINISTISTFFPICSAAVFSSGLSSPITTTWSSSDQSNVVLFAGATIALMNGGSGGVRAITAHSGGTYYMEYTFRTAGAGDVAGVAGSNATFSLLPVGGCTVQASAGQIWLNGTQLSGLGAFNGTTDVLGMAVDATNSRIWFRKNSGNWNGSVTASPASGIGGIAISILSGAVYPVFGSGNNGGRIYANFSTGPSYPTPVGFTAGWLA